MKHLPVGCSARYDAIQKLSDELVQTFVNGNRSDFRKAIMSYPKAEALAILGGVYYLAGTIIRDDISHYLMEAA